MQWHPVINAVCKTFAWSNLSKVLELYVKSDLYLVLHVWCHLWEGVRKKNISLKSLRHLFYCKLCPCHIFSIQCYQITMLSWFTWTPTTAAWGCNSSQCLLLHSKSVTWKNSWNLNAMALNSLYYSDAKMRNCTPVIITSFKRGITNTNHGEIIFLKNSRLVEIWNVTVFLLNRGLTSGLWSTLKVFKKTAQKQHI